MSGFQSYTAVLFVYFRTTHTYTYSPSVCVLGVFVLLGGDRFTTLTPVTLT